jgi:hypothetical protein
MTPRKINPRYREEENQGKVNAQFGSFPKIKLFQTCLTKAYQ